MTYLVFDAVIAAVLLLALYRGYKRGFVLTLCGFLAIFVAFIGATFLSSLLAQPVSAMIRPVIETNISRALEQGLEDAGWSAAEPQDAPSTLPLLPGQGSEEESDPLLQLPLDQAMELLKDSKLYRLFSDAVHSAVNEGLLQVTTSAARTIAGCIALEIARMVLFFISFILILVAWFLFSHALDLAFRLPVLSTLNHWSGAAVGLIKGVFLVFIAVWLLRDSLIPPQAVEQTLLLRFFCTTNPLSLLLGLFQKI